MPLLSLSPEAPLPWPSPPFLPTPFSPGLPFLSAASRFLSPFPCPFLASLLPLPPPFRLSCLFLLLLLLALCVTAFCPFVAFDCSERRLEPCSDQRYSLYPAAQRPSLWHSCLRSLTAPRKDTTPCLPGRIRELPLLVTLLTLIYTGTSSICPFRLYTHAYSICLSCRRKYDKPSSLPWASVPL